MHRRKERAKQENLLLSEGTLMHRLMIADDEYLSRFVIKSMIEKKFPDIEIWSEPEKWQAGN